MSLHEDLFDAAAEVILEVQGTPAMYQVLLKGAAEPLRVDGTAGAVSIERSERQMGPGARETEQLESLVAKMSAYSADGTIWEPQYSMKVLRGADKTKWSVDSISGVGTAIYTVKLVRPYLVDVQRTGRERGAR